MKVMNISEMQNVQLTKVEILVQMLLLTGTWRLRSNCYTGFRQNKECELMKVTNNPQKHQVQCTKAETQSRMRLSKETCIERNKTGKAFPQKQECRVSRVVSTGEIDLLEYAKV
jgi:hypothetical protein